MKLTVRKVIGKSGNAISYVFSDGSAGVWDLRRDSRGFLTPGPGHTLTGAQHVAVSEYKAEVEKPEGGWL